MTPTEKYPLWDHGSCTSFENPSTNPFSLLTAKIFYVIMNTIDKDER